MKIFDRYLLKNMVIASLFIAVTLALIVFLTQSLRFLDLVLNAGSSSSAFWVLTLLALPRFFEVILPLSVMASTLFLYNKMTVDSEITAMRAMGHSPLALARPTLIWSVFITFILWNITFWVAPNSMAQMQKMRMELTTEFSNILFREGIFNAVGKGLTVYIKERNSKGELVGLMIHDTRNEGKPPSTVLARRGVMVVTETGQQVIVFDGSRQEFNPKTGALQRLAFDRYTIDLPEGGTAEQRWAEPDERNIFQLLRPDLTNERDVENLREFSIEIHRRLTSPLLVISFSLVALSALLIGPMDRRGQAKRIALALVLVMLMQGLFLTSYNIAKHNNFGLVLMYILTLVPIGLGLFSLSGASESLRRDLLYRMKGSDA